MFREWDERRETDWDLLSFPAHDAFHRYMGELNRLYLKDPCLWALDHTYAGFKWTGCNSDDRCVFGYTRTDGKQTLLVLLNFSDREANVSPEVDGKAAMIMNTDWERFGGKTAESGAKTLENRIAAFSGILYRLSSNTRSDAI